MPIEYVAPGVYVEEVEGGVCEIAGVPTSTTGFTAVYAHEMTLPSHRLPWTEPNRGDPGITLVGLLAWLGEAVLYRVAEPRSGPVNIAVFVSSGALDEQRVAVSLDDLRRVACSRTTHGVADGLAVESPGNGKPEVRVDAGAAIDDGGNEIGPGDGRLPPPSQCTGVRRKKAP